MAASPLVKQGDRAVPLPVSLPLARHQRNHAEDVRLYLLRGSTQIPIGSVGSFGARRFVIPPSQVGSSGVLQLVAQTLGSRTIAAPEALDIEPGAEVEFRIESNLKYSRLVPRVYRPQ